jgi:serine protease Do
MARSFNLPQRSGLLVQRVVFSSPLGRIGVKGGSREEFVGDEKLIVGGDIILSFDGIEFDTTDEALIELAQFAENRLNGPAFEVTVWRDGRVVKLGRKE